MHLNRRCTPTCVKRTWLRHPGRATANSALFFLSASLFLISVSGTGCAKRSQTAHNASVGSPSAAARPAEHGAVDNQGSIMKLHSLPWLIDGKPILGTYLAGTDRMADLKKIQAVGMNLILGDENDLNPTTAEGAYCRKHGIKVLYHLTNTVYHGVKLAEPVTARQSTIPLFCERRPGAQDTHIVQIDDELIFYESLTPTALINCQRGYGGTQPAAHHEGTILFWPQACADQVERIKDSPNLFGYYVLDDSPGDAVSALRALYRTVQKADPGGRHPVCAGFGDAGSIVNLAPGVCDIMFIYWYPVSTKRYERERTSQEVQRMLTTARTRVPGIPFVGIYQAFDGSIAQTGQGVPTAEQLREQLEDFVREGASGLVAFITRAGDLPGWADLPDLEQVITKAHREILESGGLHVRPETESMRKKRIQPQGHWQDPQPLYGVVPAWYVIAPFADTLNQGLDAQFPPDGAVDLAAVYATKFGKSGWRKRESTCGAMGFTSFYGAHGLVRNCMAYAVCEVISPTEQFVRLLFCSDDDAIIRQNGKEVYRFQGVRGLEYDKEVIPLTLPAGKSRFEVKVYNRAGMWGLFMRFTDANGRPMTNLQFLP